MDCGSIELEKFSKFIIPNDVGGMFMFVSAHGAWCRLSGADTGETLVQVQQRSGDIHNNKNTQAAN